MTTTPAPARKKKRSAALGKDARTQTELHLMLLPGTVSMLVFGIVPLFGLLIAFRISGRSWALTASSPRRGTTSRTSA